jgi:hypothetical protein
MLVCYIVGGVLVSLLTLHLFLEIHYFLRMCLCVIIARFFKTKIKILDDTYMYGKLILLTPLIGNNLLANNEMLIFLSLLSRNNLLVTQ